MNNSAPGPVLRENHVAILPKVYVVKSTDVAVAMNWKMVIILFRNMYKRAARMNEVVDESFNVASVQEEFGENTRTHTPTHTTQPTGFLHATRHFLLCCCLRCHRVLLLLLVPLFQVEKWVSKLRQKICNLVTFLGESGTHSHILLSAGGGLYRHPPLQKTW